MNPSAMRKNRQAFGALTELLNHAHPRSDMTPLVTQLEGRFLNAYSVFSADSLLLERSGMEPRDALLVSRMQELNRYMEGVSAEKPKLDTLEAASQYLIRTMSTLNVEQFHLLCLDSRGRLTRRVILEEGTEDAALFSLKDVITNVVRYSPSALILAHNHPRRTLRPSQEDLDCTSRAVQVLKALGVPLLDHIIVAGKNAVSIRDNRFLPAHDWLRQAPENRLLRNWLGEAAGSDWSFFSSDPMNHLRDE